MNTTATDFTRHSQVVPIRGIISPRPVTVFPVRVNPALLSTATKAERDAYLDRQIELERQHNLAAESEAVTEAQRFPTRDNPHDD